MVLFVQRISGDRDFYVLTATKDFEPIFEHYPNTRHIAMMSHGLRHAAENIAKYLSNHHLTAWVEDNTLNKGLKDWAVGLGLGAAAMSSLSGYQPPTKPPSAQIQQAENFGAAPEDKFLWSIMQLESSGGRDIAHKHPNVIGRWGIKKPTINEMIDRAGANVPDNLKVLRHMDSSQAASYFKQYPQAELDIARAVAKHVLRRQQGDHYKSAYSWLHGHNLYSHDIPSAAVQSSDYVQKFKYVHAKNPIGAKPVLKSEDKQIFSKKLSDWIAHRMELERELQMDHTFTPDPGRQKDDEQERKDDKDGNWRMRLKVMSVEAERRDK